MKSVAAIEEQLRTIREAHEAKEPADAHPWRVIARIAEEAAHMIENGLLGETA